MPSTSTGQIESAKVSINEIFSRFWIKIPSYQRSYIWGTDEIFELIEDILFAANNNSDSQYFLGSMVLRRSSRSDDNVNFEEYELLDGQQRLTTLMLILACVRDRTQDEDLRKSCQDMLYQKENRWKSIPGRNRIIYEIRDNVQEFIDEFINKDGGSQSDRLTDFRESKNLSLSNMAHGIEAIHACFDNQERFNNLGAFNLFVRYLINNTIFIYVSTDNFDDAFRLFTILNDRGIPLSNSDILKAKNLGAITTANDQRKWAEYWEDIEGELGRDEFDRFLSLLRTIYIKDKAREGLLKEFDERIYGANPKLLSLGTKTFEAIKLHKSAYDKCILLEDLPSSIGNEYKNRIAIMRRGLQSTDWMPPVISWTVKFGTQSLLEFLKQVENKFSSDWITQMTPTQRINNMNLILSEIEKAKDPETVLFSKLFQTDFKQIKTALNDNIYKRKFTKYILLRLELIASGNSSLLNLPDDISVEHILPQSPRENSNWTKDYTDEDREKWVHRLGNLMLLSRRKNTSLGNLDFANKKQKYLKDRVESLPNSFRVISMDSFGPSELETRHGQLISQLKESYKKQ